VISFFFKKLLNPGNLLPDTSQQFDLEGCNIIKLQLAPRVAGESVQAHKTGFKSVFCCRILVDMTSEFPVF
jgi:hypothetical protein